VNRPLLVALVLLGCGGGVSPAAPTDVPATLEAGADAPEVLSPPDPNPDAAPLDRPPSPADTPEEAAPDLDPDAPPLDLPPSPRDAPEEAVSDPGPETAHDTGLEDPGSLADPALDAPGPDRGAPGADAEDVNDPGQDAGHSPLPCTFDAPCPVPRLPFVLSDSTLDAPSRSARRYDCAPSASEEGPERVYRVTLPGPGTLVLEVQEAPGVDVDLHLLPEQVRPGADGVVSGCLGRADLRLSQVRGPGTFLVVVDTYGTSSTARPGAFTLAIEHEMTDTWQEVPVAPGVLWRRKTYSNLLGGRQTVRVLEVRPSLPEVTIRPFGGRGRCSRTSEEGRKAGALAAINGGFFDPSTCASLGLVQIDGQPLSANGVAKMRPHATLGLTPEDHPVLDFCTDCRSWAGMRQALGAYPNLVTGGAIDINPWYDEPLFTGRHPRTGIGLRSDGTLLLVTVDGRTEAGVGMTLRDFAQYFLWLGADRAANLDGGGSTTMWIEGMSLNGVVNFPSDNQAADHQGERAVANGLLILRQAP